MTNKTSACQSAASNNDADLENPASQGAGANDAGANAEIAAPQADTRAASRHENAADAAGANDENAALTSAKAGAQSESKGNTTPQSGDVANAALETETAASQVAASTRVCAIVVTFNRRALLGECLSALQKQTRAVEQILVVDNASSDGTREMLAAEFPSVRVLALAENVGGAGGFHAGMEAAYAAGFDWLWLMDDDGQPAQDCLENMMRHAAPHRVLLPMQQDELGRVYGITIGTRNVAHEIIAQSEPMRGKFHFTFVGPLIPRRVVTEIGLPNKDFFIWLDDWDYAMRIQAQRDLEIVAVPDAIFFHQPGGAVKTVKFLGRSSIRVEQQSWKIYYGTRNGLYILLRSEIGRSRKRREMLRFALGESKLLLGDLIYEPERWQRARMRLQGARDGFAGRLGKRV